MVHTVSKTPTALTRSHSQNQAIPSKLPKNIDKRDLISSGRFSETGDDTMCIYRIGMENMTGRRDLEFVSDIGSSTSLRNSSSEESMSKTETVSMISDECCSEGSMHTLDYIHPINPDNTIPMIHTSFEEERPITMSTSSHGGSGVGGGGSGGRQKEQREVTSMEQFQDGGRIHCDTSLRHTIMESGSDGQLMESESVVRGHTEGEESTMRSNGFEDVNVPPWQQAEPAGSQSPSRTKLRRARKVLTSRKSLDSGSRWLYPYFGSPERSAGDVPLLNHVTDHVAGRTMMYSRDIPEILGMLENVVYSSPDSGMHDDLSLSSNNSDNNSTQTGETQPSAAP